MPVNLVMKALNYEGFLAEYNEAFRLLNIKED
jgi:hypothetical protein